MTFRIKLKPEGQDILTGVLPNMNRKFVGGIQAALNQAGFNLVKTAKDGMQRETKKGRVYKRRGRRSRRASAAGQYPGIVTGQTIQSVFFEIRGGSQMEFGIKDRTDGPKDLPKMLEEGTSKMKPRPTLGLSHKAREKDTLNYLRRMPFDGMTKK